MSAADPQVPAPGDPLTEHPLLEGHHSDREYSESLLAYVHQPPRRGWWALLAVGLAGTALLTVAVSVTLLVGVGTWGNNIPVAWAFGITNFVWWIGIGHAGTLISAILLLLQEKWRGSINRFAEAMTLFAVTCAGLFPLLHLGRPWKFYWLVPYPSSLRAWPQFRSPLTWDIAAVSTYLTVSLLFWFLGLLPDLATARDTAKTPRARFWYGLASLGWRGSARHWRQWRTGYLLLAGLATPLVVSVHTIVSFDFAVSQLPGWHTTVFPPYFVAGAVFSGFALVLTLLIPARKALGIEHVVTPLHLDNMAKVLLATGWMVAYGYIQEHFFAWFSGNPFEMHATQAEFFGPYAPLFWMQVTCNVLVPQLFWSSRLRTNVGVLWVASLLINVGMWTERFLIVVASLSMDFLPSSWAPYRPTWVDWSLLGGTVAFFGTAFLLFLKLVPPVSVSETKELQREVDASLRFRREHERPKGGAP
ncbi:MULTISPECIES: NrfD/PsrC family molybdoenzyme membrane anchor subunit [Corallococcus]|uniref:NrfD/PsrC family molybdoenzyme membrane anchor subunit n=1 Tax=Corallococcus TaxID=83461 RepID=UPI00118021B8|nr:MULTISPECIES: NrfD/PsrC family molybdoenzyme membrane anchor subunit [Corallococcus]NBD12760.1 hydrogenase [Corallococcus silvisoli]TSC23164.1 hydrogenase [Corallococcus sp. Z5C101001]